MSVAVNKFFHDEYTKGVQSNTPLKKIYKKDSHVIKRFQPFSETVYKISNIYLAGQDGSSFDARNRDAMSLS